MIGDFYKGSKITDKVQYYIKKWKLELIEEIASTNSSWVVKVKKDSKVLVLKVFTPEGIEYEALSSWVLEKYKGRGAVRLHCYDEGAQLLEFLPGEQVKQLVIAGQDDLACEVLVKCLENLHATSVNNYPSSIPTLEKRFQSLFQLPKKSSLLEAASDVAKGLLKNPREIVLLHGDVHHENVMRDSEGEWKFIDPQNVIGERTYDFANIMRNPQDYFDIISDQEFIKKRLEYFSEAAGLDKERLLQFAFAHAGLSIAWAIMDGVDQTDWNKNTEKMAKIFYTLLKSKSRSGAK